MFNRYWIYLALFLIPAAFVLHVRALLVISALLLTIIPVAWLWNRLSLRQLDYQRSFGERRAFPGEIIDVTLRVSNHKLLPLGWLLVEDQWPPALPPEEGHLFLSPGGQVGYCLNAFSIRWFERSIAAIAYGALGAVFSRSGRSAWHRATSLVCFASRSKTITSTG